MNGNRFPSTNPGHARIKGIHRETYPEQYEHPLVGRQVVVDMGGDTILAAGKVERVVNSRFGKLAIIEGDKEGRAWATKDCKTTHLP